MLTNPAFGTPKLVVRGNRGVPVRALTYNRQSIEDALDERIERTVFNPLGQVASRIDPRLFTAGASPNFAYVLSLSGRALRTDSVDAGTHWILADVDGRPVWARDARGTGTTWTYDTLGRPLTTAETVHGQPPATREVWQYGEEVPNAQAHNLRGRCVRHYDTAGMLAWSGFRLTGQPVDQTRQLLADAEAEVNWAGQDETAWTKALDPMPYPTAWDHDATGTWVKQTDAKGNAQQRGFDVGGRLANSGLTLAGGVPKAVLSAIDYSAAGQVLSETAGNGAISTHEYEPETQRLIRLSVTRPAQGDRPITARADRVDRAARARAFRRDQSTLVQDLHYTYDPVGNVVSVRDAAQATSYMRNQKVEPALAYTYDTLYQLISATGRETANRGRQGHTLPPATIPLPSDDSTYTNYTRTYTYDRGGNLTAIQHQGVLPYTQSIVVSDRGNHALLQNATGTLKPADIDNGNWFDAAGNQKWLLPDASQPLAWNSRDRLKIVTLVKRDSPSSQNDREAYQYGSGGMRARKRMWTQAGGTTQIVEAIYLPGLTLRLTSRGSGDQSTVVEALQEIESQAGSIRARCLHWDTGQPGNLANDSTRYGLGDRNSSVGLELDDQAALISREEYYPYGGTAVWTSRTQIEADTKFVRYSGKERDATGLCDHGYRYYQPWIGRWLSSDPAGIIDGLNLYAFVGGNPITRVDMLGLSGDDTEPEQETDTIAERPATVNSITAGLSSIWSKLAGPNAAQRARDQALDLALQNSLSEQERDAFVTQATEAAEEHGDISAYIYQRKGDIVGYVGPRANGDDALELVKKKNRGDPFSKLGELGKVTVLRAAQIEAPEEPSTLAPIAYEFSVGQDPKAQTVKRSKANLSTNANPGVLSNIVQANQTTQIKPYEIDVTGLGKIIAANQLSDRDVEILHRTIGEVRQRRTNAVHWHAHERGLWSADLPGFRGQGKRGAWRLMFQQIKGGPKDFRVHSIRDPH